MNKSANKWLKLLQPDSWAFEDNLDNCAHIQNSLLLNILQNNKSTVYGQKHHFTDIKDYHSFSQSVPIVTYKDLKPYISNIAAGQKNILTTDEVIRFEVTSGSSGSNKMIPYTQSLISDFQRGVGAWMHALNRSYPNALAQRFYLALSPRLMSEHPQSAVPVGNGDDLAYFEKEASYALAPCLILPKVNPHANAEDFYLQTVQELLKGKLSLISCWSPTYLLQIDDLMRRHWRKLGLPSDDFLWCELWPSLALVSCWTDASSTMFIDDLKKRLGDISIESKGLLSTECICSIPYKLDMAPILTYTSHFYEFEDNTGNVLLAEDLSTGQEYNVIVTTNGGLYRYKTGDQIRVTDYWHSVPAFTFIGRQGRISDIAGEKLSEAQVNEAFLELKLPPAVLAAEKDGYLLCCEIEPENICVQLDDILKGNCYYKQARDLGQLKEINYQKTDATFFEKMRRLLQQKGVRDGTMKFNALLLFDEWQQVKDLH